MRKKIYWHLPTTVLTLVFNLPCIMEVKTITNSENNHKHKLDDDPFPTTILNFLIFSPSGILVKTILHIRKFLFSIGNQWNVLLRCWCILQKWENFSMLIKNFTNIMQSFKNVGTQCSHAYFAKEIAETTNRRLPKQS